MTSNPMDEPNQAGETHLESYCSHFRVCIGKLRSIWKQVGNEPNECHSQVMVAAEQAMAAWTQAVERAEAERLSIKAMIQQHSSEISSIKAELDDGVEMQSPDAEVSSEGEATLLKTLDVLKSTLQFWRLKRAARMQAYQALMDVHVCLKRQLGLKHPQQPAGDDADLSTGALEYLQMENGKLQDEKSRRISRAEDLLDSLRAVCRELGEDASGAAAEVHPALVGLSAEKESAEVLGSVYRLVGSPAHLAAQAGADLDLSDGMFERLQAKIGDMQRLKVEREAQSRDVLEMLGSLWDALSIPEDAPERSMVHKLLSGERPQRLHKRTLDKCLAEVNRLEGAKAQAMRDLALAKARELEQLCISTRISPPHTGPLLAELDKPGQMTQVLSKLVRLVAEVQTMAAKRAPILSQVSELLAAQADSAWLRSYNQNENRYKGRDASRNMQRAIKAGKLRERLAPMMESLLAALAEWELEEGGPFLYDEQVLQDTQLKVVEAELEQIALEKVPKPKNPGSMPTPVTSGKPPASRPGTAAPSGGQPPRGPSGAPRAPTSSGGGAPTSSSLSASDRPSLTPRSTAGFHSTAESGPAASRRLSLASSSSARDAGVFRGPGGGANNSMQQFLGAAAAIGVTGGKAMTRSNDFTPGALRSAMAATTTTSSSAAAHPGATPPGAAQRRSSLAAASSPAVSSPAMGSASRAARNSGSSGTGGAAAATAAAAANGGGGGSGAMISAEDSGSDDVAAAAGGAAPTNPTMVPNSAVKNSAQDLFRRYLGDPSLEPASNKPTPSKVQAASPSTTRPATKLSFSSPSHAPATPSHAAPATPNVCPPPPSSPPPPPPPCEDDGADDVRATKCDTPKSTASSRSRQQQQQQGGTAQQQKPGAKASPVQQQQQQKVFSPEGKVSRIPRVRA